MLAGLSWARWAGLVGRQFWPKVALGSQLSAQLGNTLTMMAMTTAIPIRSKAKKPSGGALAASDRRRSRIMSTEAKHKWTHQYYQGLDVNNFPELESEAVPSSTVKADFISPFEGEGIFEVVAGREGPGSGAVRLSRVKDGHSNTFIVPIRPPRRGGGVM
ncbi:hypothetical protein MRS44_003860 [Fusarium solani]|uniref:uncharacterized protein n=1 Tax=Fusarium solani TaxID=169388 RepID=UPI0032C47F5B|nr:hypothetical protein MRS44_003860 [Fusarium solani]